MPPARPGNSDDAQGMQSVIELVLALSVHDKATRGHSERVRVFADLIADELKIDEDGQARLRWAALLHDVGKLEVPVALLNKPGQPDEDEWKILHRHPAEGARLVAPLLPWLGEWGRAVVEHHERYDGTGYPHRLKGTEISLAARIVAVADVYEVMTAPRPYKRAMSIAAARQNSPGSPARSSTRQSFVPFSTSPSAVSGGRSGSARGSGRFQHSPGSGPSSAASVRGSAPARSVRPPQPS